MVALEVNRVPSLQILMFEGRHGDHPGLELIERVLKTIEVLAGGQDGEIGVAAKLGCAVQHARLTAHQ
jgi:hypothetical protein